MKVKIEKNAANEYAEFTIRILRADKERLDEIANSSELTRNKVIQAILSQIFEDPKFVLRLEK